MNFLTKKEVIEQLTQGKQVSTISEQLVLYALHDKRSEDNITVVAIQL